MSKGYQRYLEVNLHSTQHTPFINSFPSAENVSIKQIAAIQSFPTYVLYYLKPFRFDLVS